MLRYVYSSNYDSLMALTVRFNRMAFITAWTVSISQTLRERALVYRGSNSMFHEYGMLQSLPRIVVVHILRSWSPNGHRHNMT
jgi:hypothetical protein